MNCPNEDCQLKISWLAQDLDFTPCSPLVTDNAGRCLGEHECNEFTISVKAKPNYQSNFRQVKGTIKLTFEVDENILHHDFLDYQVENRPTSQCHLWTFGHLVTFDQFRKQIDYAGDHILLQNEGFLAVATVEECQYNQR